MRTKRGTFALIVLVAALLLAPTTVEAADRYFRKTEKVTGKTQATCRPGWKLVGGGYMTAQPFESFDPASGWGLTFEYHVWRNGPSASNARRWETLAYSVTTTYRDGVVGDIQQQPIQADVYALCIR